MQFTSINHSQCSKRGLKLGVPQGSVLGSLLFMPFSNDLRKNIEFSTVHHFADDTNMLLVEESFKILNKHVNRDLKLVVEWIKTNKLSLNINKTELLIFKSRNKTKQLLHKRSKNATNISGQIPSGYTTRRFIWRT